MTQLYFEEEEEEKPWTNVFPRAFPYAKPSGRGWPMEKLSKWSERDRANDEYVRQPFQIGRKTVSKVFEGR